MRFTQFAIFKTKLKFTTAEQVYCNHFGYPNKGAERYADERKKDKMWIMPVIEGIKIEHDGLSSYKKEWQPKGAKLEIR